MWSGVERVVAVGDVHGDLGQFVTILRAAGVIDKNEDWIAGKTHLVQTGDVLDRGPDSRKAMDLLMKLETQAARAGGAVHALIGNHEAMVLAGAYDYVHPGEPESFGGADAFRKAMSTDGKYGQWIRGHDAVIQINDVLFVHGGLQAAYADKSLAQINQAVRKELGRYVDGGITDDMAGPLWSRIYVLEDASKLTGLVTVLAARRARAMVIGHTVSSRGVVARAGGRVVQIDVGMTAYYGHAAACLLIEKGVFYVVPASGQKRKLESIAASAPAAAQTQPVPAVRKAA